MLKKLLVLAVLAGFPFTAWSTTPAHDAVAHQKSIKTNMYTIKVTQQGKLLADDTVAAANGYVTPIESESQVSYVSRSTKHKNGVTEITSGVYKTGEDFILTPSESNGNTVDFSGTVRNFVKMGHGFDHRNIPVINTQTFKQTLYLPKGKTMVINSWSKVDGALSIAITRE